MYSWEQFDNLIFTKQDLKKAWSISSTSLNNRIQYSLGTGRILRLKNGLYVTCKSTLKLTIIASRIYSPSYLSMEYVLGKYGLLPKTNQLTCISTKTNRKFTNHVGDFRYSRVKKSLFFGFKGGMASKAKALFDYFYLNPALKYRNFKKLKKQIFDHHGITWANFSEKDYKQFDQYVWKSKSKKMMVVLRAIDEHFEKQEFDRWAKELLN